jgi:hypothetical protein
MTRVGKKVLHGSVHEVGTIVAQHEHYVEVQIPGYHRTLMLVNWVADKSMILERSSFDYRPGDRDAI